MQWYRPAEAVGGNCVRESIRTLQHREAGIRGAEPAGRGSGGTITAGYDFKANKAALTESCAFSGQIYIWPIYCFDLKEFTVNKWRNPLGGYYAR